LNETWAREGATVLARTDHPFAAWWQMGNGRVIAFAFDVDGELIERAADAFSSAPRDPRFGVWLDGAKLSVILRDAASEDPGVKLQARVVDGERLELERVAPDRWEAIVPRSTEARVVEVRSGDRVLDRAVVPAGYPREFQRIGLNRRTLEELGRRTGGAIVDADDASPLALPPKPREIPLRPWLAAAAAVVVMTALFASRR
jgi:hypothetical protein